MPRNTEKREMLPRKSRSYVSKETIKNFLYHLQSEKKQKEIMFALNLSRSKFNRLTQRFLNGDFEEGKKISSREEKKTWSEKKDISSRTSAINVDLANYPCTTLESINLI
ncbi:hypothetical protein DMUE_0511 [Dictyocoela muelleri]|nr:hypothetical protein DMUE_0511 [Dictyocoela muelleri]